MRLGAAFGAAAVFPVRRLGELWMESSRVMALPVVSARFSENLTRRSAHSGHKKSPVRSLILPRMGLIAGWLHHPAHAPYYHDKNHCDLHDRYS
ncbi:hypothetical protein HJB67_05190 [Rhizobium lentis]|uniref:hypothetical protein n=1 Tax=Rhizobium lentis TaxID=1138194 RepID=UPI001C840A44|nr:hypothetical protein [Rhizobium lentis]MBX5009375.1 hypothetical protein [Rhizobium lentis]